MEDLYLYWKSKIGCEVIFTGEMKMLDKGTVGILSNVFDKGIWDEAWCSIVYPQNSAYDYDGDKWKPKKNAPMKIYSHSAKLSKIKLAGS